MDFFIKEISFSVFLIAIGLVLISFRFKTIPEYPFYRRCEALSLGSCIGNQHGMYL